MDPERRGDGYGGVILNLGKDVRDRQDCLASVADWIADERNARKPGAPGA